MDNDFSTYIEQLAVILPRLSSGEQQIIKLRHGSEDGTIRSRAEVAELLKNQQEKGGKSRRSSRRSFEGNKVLGKGRNCWQGFIVSV